MNRKAITLATILNTVKTDKAGFLLILVFSYFGSFSQQKKPNVLVITADDIGISNISAYGNGIVGYRTPNIDRLAKEGALLTDY